MKLSIVAFALAASASANPMRIVNAVDSPAHPNTLPPKETAEQLERKPCYGHAHTSASYLPGPIGALLSRIGFKQPKHHDWLESAVHHGHEQMDGMEHWRSHVEALIHDGEGKVLPYLHGGMVRILPINELQQSQESEQENNVDGGSWKSLEGENGVKKHRHHGPHRHYRHHHKHKHGFAHRLHRAIRHLSTSEAIALAFVMGAGIGSILHFVFMLCVLGIRRGRCLRSLKERRAARKAARAARKAERMARKEERKMMKECGIRSEEEDVLPGYSEGEAEEVVDKA